MKQYLRSRVSIIASYLEILISIILVIGIAIASISLVIGLYNIKGNITGPSFMSLFEQFISSSLIIVIGIEFIKMLTKHTPESVLEVLLFTIARKMVVDHTNSLDILIGILALAILFAIKKFIFTPNLSDPNGFILSGTTSIKEANIIAHIDLPNDPGKSVAELLAGELDKESIPLQEGSYISLHGAKLKVYSLTDGKIDMVEVSSLKKRFFP